MSISAIYGLEYFKVLRDQTVSSLNGYGKLPFHLNNIHNGAGRFQFTLRNGRMWLTSVPASSTRAEYTYRGTCRKHEYIYSYSQYRYIWTCVLYNYPTDWTITNERRRRDSSSRSPSVIMPVTSLWGEYLNQEDCRHFTAGVRLWCPTAQQQPPYPVGLSRVGGDTDNREIDLLSNNELPEEDAVESYFEFTLDRKTGVVRRWLDGVELNRRTLSSWGVANFESLHLHIGGKHTSTAATAPEMSYFSFNDLYALVDTSHRGDDTLSSRLGEVSVDHLPVNNFLLNRFWESPAEAPTVTVNRIKTTDVITNQQELVGDTHADPATVVFNNGVMELDTEDLYIEVSAFGHYDSTVPVMLNTEAINDDGLVARSSVALPPNNLSIDPTHSKILSLEAKVGGSKLRTVFTNDFQLKLSFSEAST